jgi:hypothetical protein
MSVTWPDRTEAIEQLVALARGIPAPMPHEASGSALGPPPSASARGSSVPCASATAPSFAFACSPLDGTGGREGLSTTNARQGAGGTVETGGEDGGLAVGDDHDPAIFIEQGLGAHSLNSSQASGGPKSRAWGVDKDCRLRQGGGQVELGRCGCRASLYGPKFGTEPVALEQVTMAAFFNQVATGQQKDAVVVHH